MSADARKIRLIMELRRSGVTDTRVLSAIERVPREKFVPEAFKDQAYENTALPIGNRQTISQPLVVAMMSQALQVGDRMKVLEVGTGSGYQAAVLAKLCRRLYTIERHAPLLAQAEALFRELRLHNITAIVGDGSRGWPEQAPFDRIMVTACAEEVPARLVEQLADGGIMVLPIGPQGGEQDLVKLTKQGGEVKVENLFAVRFVPLVVGEAE
jgi:protein-L-isoaspartate(D-aspartate) O-methyltransferase